MNTRTNPNRRLLVVDDDFPAREMMSMLLAGEGYRVATAANGAEGLERLKDHDRPCLILLDLNMPVMDGPTFCQRRGEDGAASSIPVVVLSAAPDAEEQGKRLGAVHCLHKPVDTIELLGAVRKCCP
jgi:CheY-like chemotaxis protein